MASPANEGGGIIANPDSDFWKVYCYRENEAFLAVETKSLSAEQTSIHLNLYTPFPDVMPCNADPNTLTLSIIYYYIPALHPPKGVAYLGGTADSHVGYAEMTADLKGDLSAEEVVDFYNDQLLAAGWKLVNRGHDEGSAWSNWTFQDDQGNDWIGSLKVDEESSSSDTLLASMTIEKIK
jgi:hypothetical protein